MEKAETLLKEQQLKVSCTAILFELALCLIWPLFWLYNVCLVCFCNGKDYYYANINTWRIDFASYSVFQGTLH